MLARFLLTLCLVAVVPAPAFAAPISLLGVAAPEVTAADDPAGDTSATEPQRAAWMPGASTPDEPVAVNQESGVAVTATADGEAVGAALETVDRMLGFDASAGNLFSRAGTFLWRLAHRDLRQPAFREWAGDEQRPATAWPLSQLLAAELDGALLSDDPARATRVMDELEKYRQGDAYAPSIVSLSGSGQQRYFDDNAWIGLDLVQLYRQTGDRRYLTRAQELVPFLESGFVSGGGLLWREGDAEPSINTCANAPAMQLFLALYRETKDERYLEDARRCDQALQGQLRRADGLYRDNVRASDTSRRDETLWSYNQGAAIGANLQMADACTDAGERQKYLQRALGTAEAALRKLDAEPDWLWKQSPAFNAVFFRNLMKLDAVSPDPRRRAALDRYLARARHEALREENGAYELGGIGRYDGGLPGGLRLIDQAGMAQLLALEALTPGQVAALS